MAYTINLVGKVAELQAEALDEREFSALMEIYDVLRLVPHNGTKLKRDAQDDIAMRTLTHEGVEVIYFIVDSVVQVAVVRINRLPSVG